MYKDKTFRVKLDYEVLRICGETCGWPCWNAGLECLPDRTRRIVSLNLTIRFFTGNYILEELQGGRLFLSTSLADALAQSRSLKNLTISIELEKRASITTATQLNEKDEDDLRALLEPFRQLRNLDIRWCLWHAFRYRDERNRSLGPCK